MDRKCVALARLAEIVEILRGPGGCPWDREQTLSDLSRYVLEEAAEVRDAVVDARGEPADSVREELGDVLMTVFLAARIVEESGAFGLAEIVEEVCDKLVRRHPHIFSDAGPIPDAGGVKARWDEIKAEEKAARGERPEVPSRLDGVPRSLPTVARAVEVSRKAAKVGLDWSDASAVLEKVREETDELAELLREPPPEESHGEASGSSGKSEPDARFERGDRSRRVEEELGDLLFTVVNLARKLTVDPEGALRRAEEKFTARFRALEVLEPRLDELSPAELDRAWSRAKSQVARHASVRDEAGAASRGSET